MPSFFITLWRLLKHLRHAFQNEEFRVLFVALLLAVLTGVLFYSSVEGWGLVDAFYFSIVTLSTVGYGDLSPKTDIGKIFTSLYILLGIGLFVAVASNIAKQIFNSRKGHNNNTHDSK